MRIPTATYRLQLHQKFPFEAAQQIVTYLTDLGISDVYASPIFEARSGSMHGYDVLDPNQINPELGGTEQFETLVSELQQHSIGWLQDIVPNHMAYDSHNPYLMDILEYGPSEDSDLFDIDWNHDFVSLKGKVLSPLLGSAYGECLSNGELKLVYDAGNFSVTYYTLKLPLRIESYSHWISPSLESLRETLGPDSPEVVRLASLLEQLQGISDHGERKAQAKQVKSSLGELYQHPEMKDALDQSLQVLNGKAGDVKSFVALDQILADQFYRLSFWKAASEEINYRRFFTVNELISVQAEKLVVFDKTHGLIKQLVESGKITGLRVDHIDGLYDPAQYLTRLKERVAPDTYITVEKILELQEDLPTEWTIEGTSGYDFLNYINGIFCQTEHEQQFEEIYQQFTGLETPYDLLAEQKKQLILEKDLAGDADNLTRRLKAIAAQSIQGSDFTAQSLGLALREVLAQFPIYRTYTASETVTASDQTFVEEAIAAAERQRPLLQPELNFLRVLLLRQDLQPASPQLQSQQLHFVMKFQQLTGPLMAKGIEDTLLYVYNRLLSLNEVGGNPSHFGISVEAFHTFNQKRCERWPHTQNTTATHDTKRGEDLRARLNVLSELPQEWQEQLTSWQALNRSLSTASGTPIPSRNDEYFLYQTLVGALPFDRSEADLIERVKAYVLKAAREAKVNTTWLHSNSEYEDGYLQFVEQILTPSDSNAFLPAFYPFQQRIAAYGIYNSLSQVLLKYAAPGTPDLYQGTELWDLSLVDPDNRRPVDYKKRVQILNDIQQRSGDALTLVQELLDGRTDGRVKLFLTTRMLQARQAYASLFKDGSYVPLTVSGSLANCVVAFARCHQDQTIVAIAPRFLTSVVEPETLPLGLVWKDTQIKLPSGWGRTWKNLITSETIAAEGLLSVSEAFQHFPGALLLSQP